jgi:hypothetical protein
LGGVLAQSGIDMGHAGNHEVADRLAQDECRATGRAVPDVGTDHDIAPLARPPGLARIALVHDGKHGALDSARETTLLDTPGNPTSYA